MLNQGIIEFVICFIILVAIPLVWRWRRIKYAHIDDVMNLTTVLLIAVVVAAILGGLGFINLRQYYIDKELIHGDGLQIVTIVGDQAVVVGSNGKLQIYDLGGDIVALGLRPDESRETKSLGRVYVVPAKGDNKRLPRLLKADEKTGGLSTSEKL